MRLVDDEDEGRVRSEQDLARVIGSMHVDVSRCAVGGDSKYSPKNKREVAEMELAATSLNGRDLSHSTSFSSDTMLVRLSSRYGEH
jgi:hypothetical protein